MPEGKEFVPFALPDIGEDEVSAAAEAIRSGWLTTGPRSAAFEEEFADFIGGGVEAIAVNSATAGLHLALEAAGVGPGDEVLVPTWTFTATAEVVRYLGATPILVDVDRETLCIDFGSAAAAITSRTRAVMPVHVAGIAIDGDKLRDFCESYNLVAIEDAAHALPATSNGVLVGAGSSLATVYSFYATKTITTGEGGMVVTRDPEIANRIRTMRLHGISRDVFNRYRSASSSWFYEVVAPGYKYNLTDPAAAIGRVQLSRAWEMRGNRTAIASRYDSAFSHLPLRLPAHPPEGDVHSWHLYIIRLADARLSRDEFIAQMSNLGVGCSVHFIPLHKHPVWRDLGGYQDSDFPVASAEFEDVVSLPIFSSMSGPQVETVISAVTHLLGDS